MSTTDNFKKGCLPGFCLLTLIVVLTGFAFQSVLAETGTQAQSKQKKAEEYIRVAQEQIKRGLYPSAQTLLKQIEDNYAPYLTNEQAALVQTLSKQVQEALDARRKIPEIIKQAEDLSASGQHQQALTLLNDVLASPYLTDQERQTVQGIIQNVQANLSAERARIQTVYEQAVQDYKQKDYEKAKAGFMQVVQSGIEPTGSITPMDYLKMIDQIQQTPPDTQPTPVPQPSQKPEEQIEIEIMQMVPETPVQPQLVVEEQPLALTAKPQPSAETLSAPAEQPTVQLPAAQTPSPSQSNQPASSEQTDSYLNEVQRRQSVQIGYTAAIVQDALAKAEQSLAQQDFTHARQSLRKAFTAIETNKLLLGDELYKSFQLQLTQKEEQVNQTQDAFKQAQALQQQQQARQLAEQNRAEMEQRRSRAIADFMQRAYAFLDEQRYEEALGQLEQLLAVDPLNQSALILKKTLEDTVRWREQRMIQEESQKEELRLLLEADRRSIPYYNEITFPKNWKEIAARREAAEKEDLDPKTTAVEKQIETIVDLSGSITEETTFEEALEILRTAVDPPLRITPIWANLVDTAFVQRETPLNIPGASLQGITLKMALELVINAVNASAISEIGYMIKEGVIIIATLEYLDTNVTNRYFHKIYDISELLSPPANFDEYNSGGWGEAGGGGTGGGTGGGGTGGGSRGGGMGGGMGGMGGGMMGGGMMGGGMMGGGMMGGGMMGGGMGGMGGGMMGGMMMTGMSGNWRGEVRAIEIIYLLQQTVRPLTWYLEGGEGRVWQYNARKLIVYQTADVHKEVEDFLKKLKEGIGDQVAIEARFLLVDENFLEEIGLDMDITSLHLGSKFGAGTGQVQNINQDSINLARPRATIIPSSLGDATTTGTPLRSSLDWDFSWGGGTYDDLAINFLIRATQMHRNTKSLSAPKAMVMNGESANIEVITERRIKTDASFTTETLTTLAGTDRTVAYFDHSIESFDTGVRLNIMPTITEDKKYVLLRIITYMDMLNNLETDTAVGLMPTPDGGGEVVTEEYSLPTIQTSSIETRVSVPDRGTVLLGGLTMTAEYEIEAGVPGLSKLPVLGRLFSNRSTVKDKSILLILVKPTIVLREEAEQDAVASLKPF